MRRLSWLTALTLLTALHGGCATGGPGPSEAKVVKAAATKAPGLQITDIKVGTGASPRLGATLVMHYTGWLYENGTKGKKFDSSVDRGQPFEFKIGLSQVIAGWDQGIASMKVGGKRMLIIPPHLAYGPVSAAGGLIPANSTLLFEVELLDVKG